MDCLPASSFHAKDQGTFGSFALYITCVASIVAISISSHQYTSALLYKIVECLISFKRVKIGGQSKKIPINCNFIPKSATQSPQPSRR